MRKGIIIAVIAVVVIAIAGMGFKYYNDRYVGETYYMKAPAAPVQTELKDDSGKFIYENGKKVTAYEYKDVTFVSEDGTKTTQRNITWESNTPMTEGNYYTAKLSSEIIVEGPNGVEQSEVPTAALEKLN